MKVICFLIFAFTSLISCAQSEYTIISELRYGEGGKRSVAFSETDGASFRFIDNNAILEKGIDTKLFKKESYYNNKNIGTEIRFHIDQAFMDSNKEVEVIGELFTYLNYSGKKEKIVGRFRHPIKINLSSSTCEKIGPYTYKLNSPIEIHDPAKFSIASQINYINKLLYEDDSNLPYYSKEVERILNFEEEEKKKLDEKFLEACYEINKLVTPFSTNGSYISNENVELDDHIKQLNSLLEIHKEENKAKKEILDSLKRDKFESAIVKNEFLKLQSKLEPLKMKLDLILFKPIATDNSNCESQIDFNIAVTYSFGSNFDRFEIMDMVLQNSENVSNNSFGIAGMTNFYLTKSSPVNPGFSLGFGFNPFDENILPMAYLGGVLSFGKKRLLSINFGMNYSPREKLNPEYESQLNTEIPSNVPNEHVFGLEYKWSPFISINIPFKWVSRQVSSSDGKAKMDF